MATSLQAAPTSIVAIRMLKLDGIPQVRGPHPALGPCRPRYRRTPSKQGKSPPCTLDAFNNLLTLPPELGPPRQRPSRSWLSPGPSVPGCATAPPMHRSATTTTSDNSAQPDTVPVGGERKLGYRHGRLEARAARNSARILKMTFRYG